MPCSASEYRIKVRQYLKENPQARKGSILHLFCDDENCIYEDDESCIDIKGVVKK